MDPNKSFCAVEGFAGADPNAFENKSFDAAGGGAEKPVVNAAPNGLLLTGAALAAGGGAPKGFPPGGEPPKKLVEEVALEVAAGACDEPNASKLANPLLAFDVGAESNAPNGSASAFLGC